MQIGLLLILVVGVIALLLFLRFRENRYLRHELKPRKEAVSGFDRALDAAKARPPTRENALSPSQEDTGNEF